MVHMRTASSVAVPDGGSGMDRKSLSSLTRRAVFALATVLAASTWSSASHAQSGGPFAGMQGVWSGGGSVTLDDGSTERIRCRATYAVGEGGNGLQQTLTCASDSYKFNLSSNVEARGGAISGTWNEASRNINGNIEGRSGPGVVQVVATAPARGFVFPPPRQNPGQGDDVPGASPSLREQAHDAPQRCADLARHIGR